MRARHLQRRAGSKTLNASALDPTESLVFMEQVFDAQIEAGQLAGAQKKEMVAQLKREFAAALAGAKEQPPLSPAEIEAMLTWKRGAARASGGSTPAGKER